MHRTPMTSPQTTASGLRRESGQRRDIQFLRAVAVGVVLVYHLWPGRFPGGFIGVDVFFVISGFLITAHLLRDASRTGRVALLSFWGRRALRLLPLATTVLVATSIAIVAWAPPSTWRPALEGVVASTFYVQNWSLAAGSVDYLARDQAPLPTQHFWSLSVEEQFYLAWPLLLIAALAIAALLSGRSRLELVRPAWGIAIAVVGSASFAYSLWLTATDPGVAYFSTATRAWQFAAGAALAFVPELLRAGARPRLRAIVAATASWVGLVLVLGGTLLIVEETPFPGTAALVPVVGAALLLWSGTAPVRFTPSTFGNLRLIERIGDLSYGIYLWHWPLIVLAPAAIGRPLGSIDKIVIIVASIALAELSKRTIEDPFRYGKIWHRTTARRFVPGLSGMAIAATSALVASTVLGVSLYRSASNTVTAEAGATALTTSPQSVVDLQPAIPDRGLDFGLMYDCFDFDATGPYRCDYGDAGAEVSIAIVGDSHAAHWIPALVAAAEDKGWRVTTFVGMNCDGLLAEPCEGGTAMLDEIARTDFDLVVMGAFKNSSTPVDEVRRSVEALQSLPSPLALIADVPSHPRSAFECLDANFRDLSGAVGCTTPRSEAVDDVPDRLSRFALEFGVNVIDVTSAFCDADRCLSVIGSVVVYQDSPSSHLTRTASTALAPLLGERLVELVG